MKRYIYGGDTENACEIKTDVVIVGCGVAGLFCALNLDPGVKCAVLNKQSITQSNSMYAQGGIAAVFKLSEQDSTEKHYEDTLTAGAGLCDPAAVRVLVAEAASSVLGLIRLGVPFDTENGEYMLTKEGGHREKRILHSGGDATGLHLTESLLREAQKRDNIKIYDGMFLCDILTEHGKASGITALGIDGSPFIFKAQKVVLATGGIGNVYKNSTNALCATGDGIAAALRAGANLADMEFVQFHPTAFVHPDNEGRYFLITEALRGEGAILKNRHDEAFMKNVHPLADLAPRDIVTRGIISEMLRSDIPNVYLDITAKPREFLKNRFPTIYNECMRRGIDIATDWIPVKPVQHYFMGGVKTDVFARTNIPGLYAVGETACTGVHGANRLASNSLLECLVFGRRCAVDICNSKFSISGFNGVGSDGSCYKINEDGYDFETKDSEIRAIATKKCGIIRNGKDLSDAKQRLGEIIESLEALRLHTKNGIETYNRATVAYEIATAALNRKKSVGAHYRTD